MSEQNIVDASAVVALLDREKGHEMVLEALRRRPSRISSVNVCEALGRLLDAGVDRDAAMQALGALRLEVVPFDYDAAVQAAAIKGKTKSIGASLGDRACLALALAAHEAGDTPTVLTADRLWTKVRWPFKIVLIR